jgi:hypothetical protein
MILRKGFIMASSMLSANYKAVLTSLWQEKDRNKDFVFFCIDNVPTTAVL